MDLKVIAQSIRTQNAPYACPLCQKQYKSLTGIMYHLGQFGPPTNVPRCVGGEVSPQASPRPPPSGAIVPASPGGMFKRKTPRRDLTWAEAQRMVEIDFDSCFRRIEIDQELEVCAMSDEEEVTVGKRGSKAASSLRGTPNPRTPQGKSGKGGCTPKGQGKSASKNKGKRKSKLKASGKENQGDSASALPEADVSVLDNVDYPDAPERGSTYFRFVEQSAEDLDELIEYDMDEEDYQWLSLVNEERKSMGLTSVPQGAFEILMDRLEKECFFESQTTVDNGDTGSNMYNIDEDAVCCICNDGECHNTNAILFCDMCNLAVHQECYGVPYIPEGQWLCRRCLQSPSRSVDCVLCPNKGGAFKQTVDGHWSHVICALWIPEVQFANTVFLEPIDGIKEIPAARWKLTCYICRKRVGACIQCAKANCYVAFHVTCCQQAGMHMKIEVVKGGEVKKVAYCEAHTPASTRKKWAAKLSRAMGKDGKGTKGVGGEEEEEEEEEERENDTGGGLRSEVDGTQEEETKEEACESVKDSAESEGTKSGKTAGNDASQDVDEDRRQLDQRRASTMPVVNIPYVPRHRLDRIIGRVSLHKKSQFIPKLVSYWKLKRQSRNGVPLLRRLQASNQGQRTATANLTEEEREVLTEQLSHWKNLRHDLERARMLVELVRKREKLKREMLTLVEEINELQLRPLNLVLKRCLDRLARKDPANIFAEPVPVDDVPDYPDIIKHPMDFGTMRKKVDTHQYATIEQFEKDFYYVWRNATIYNQKDTIYYRAAVRIRDAGTEILKQAREQLVSAGVEPYTGLHVPDIQEPPPLTPNTIATVVHEPDIDLDELDEERAGRDRLSSVASVSIDEQLQFLEEKLSVLQSSQNVAGASRRAREKALRRELSNLRRQLRLERKAMGSESDDHSATLKRPPPPITRNAEELASHVLHGSLRLTPSRQQILSFSGIRLEDRVNRIQEEAPPPELDPVLVKSHNSAESVGDEKEEEEEEEEEVVMKVSVKRKRQIRLPKHHIPVAPSSRSDSYIRVRGKRKKGRDRNRRRKDEEEEGQVETPKTRPSQSKRERLESSASEVDHPPVNGIRTVTHRPVTRGVTGRNRSSSLSETAAEELSGDTRQMQSPGSDRSSRIVSPTLESATIPSATSMESLTVQPALVTKASRKQGTKRRQGTESSRSGASMSKKQRLDSESESLKRTKTINGLVNGDGVLIKPMDLVWAKCRGYPPYPALVIDPDIPRKGMKVNGERIQAPSDEVMELRDKNPAATYLVRFFDGRRTWQWLPPEKVEPLGVNMDFDTAKIASSGSRSKRSVQQAYQRARQYQRRMTRTGSNSTTSTSSDSDSESDSSA